MTHTVFGKTKSGKASRLVVVGMPKDEADVRESVQGSHPDFVIEQIVEGDVAESNASKVTKKAIENA